MTDIQNSNSMRYQEDAWEERKDDRFLVNVKNHLFEIWDMVFEMDAVSLNNFTAKDDEKNRADYEDWLERKLIEVSATVNGLNRTVHEYAQMKKDKHMKSAKKIAEEAAFQSELDEAGNLNCIKVKGV